MSDRFADGVLAGRRGAFAHSGAWVRKKLAEWRLAEKKRGLFVSSLLWSVTEDWCMRLEALAAELDAAASVGSQEQASAPQPKRRKAKRRR